MSTKTYGPYSPSRQVGDYIYTSGQVGVDPATQKAAQTVDEQTHQVLRNLQSVLAAQGATLSDVCKTAVFVKDMADFTVVNEVYGSYFTEPYPARSCVEVAGLPRVAGETELLVEIEAVAYRSQS